MSTEERVYGFYSEKAENYFGYVLWKNKEGQSVKVTEVRHGTPEPTGLWEDVKSIGEVSEFVSSHWKERR